jgi:hypothetical protein
MRCWRRGGKTVAIHDPAAQVTALGLNDARCFTPQNAVPAAATPEIG